MAVVELRESRKRSQKEAKFVRGRWQEKKKGKGTCVEDEWCMMGLAVIDWTCCRKLRKKDAEVSNKIW